MERTWHDIRKDSLEAFRETFLYLEQSGLLDMMNPIHRLVLYLIYQPRIQPSLDRSKDAWNLHQIRTAGNRSPIALYELSREKAIRRGYWTGDPGDDIGVASHEDYGVDEDIGGADDDCDAYAAHVEVNADGDLKEMQELLGEMNLQEEDENWGIDIYCRAVLVAEAAFESQFEAGESD